MALADTLKDEQDRVDQHRDDWSGDYNGESCENCGRERVELCSNGKRRCEKCGWCPEDQMHIPDSIF